VKKLLAVRGVHQLGLVVHFGNESVSCLTNELVVRFRPDISRAQIDDVAERRRLTMFRKLVVSDRLRQASNLQTIYDAILAYPVLGPFLALQYTIDLNYSSMLDFEERDFVVAGPEARDGISKCFHDAGRRSAEDIIYWVSERHEAEFTARGLEFTGLFGRRLQPVDCQNLFCEISKYARAAHPDVAGIANRLRIKQSYRPDARPMPEPMFPPRWGWGASSSHPRHLPAKCFSSQPRRASNAGDIAVSDCLRTVGRSPSSTVIV